MAAWRAFLDGSPPLWLCDLDRDRDLTHLCSRGLAAIAMSRSWQCSRQRQHQARHILPASSAFLKEARHVFTLPIQFSQRYRVHYAVRWEATRKMDRAASRYSSLPRRAYASARVWLHGKACVKEGAHPFQFTC